jgi:pimeloyl-ACP methyl ester carboxylesterase
MRIRKAVLGRLPRAWRRTGDDGTPAFTTVVNRTDRHPRITYELRSPLLGAGRPWLVLIQGLGFDRAGWEPVTDALRRDFRLVLIDNRGSGDSERTEGRFTVADMARDVVAVLDHAGIDRAHLLGISLGGMIAQEVAAGYPDRVNGLVLVATTPGWPTGYPMPRQGVATMAATNTLAPLEAARLHVENALAARTVRERPELVEQLLEHVLAHPTDRPAWAAQTGAGAGYIGHGHPSRITAPTLVLQGDADTVVDPRNATLLASRIPNAELVIFGGAGHLVFWEEPDAFAAEVAGFLLAGGRRSAARRDQPAPRDQPAGQPTGA